MKKIMFGLFAICLSAFIHAQDHGLENIIVEKYYVSDTNDAKAAQGGHLRAGSVTYRIFVDMLPACRFQAAYGVPGHELRIATTTSFFNNEEAGAFIANDVPRAYINKNTVMLDSWLSVGAASQNNYALPKSDDTTKAVINADGLLQNADPVAGIPIKNTDGFYAAAPLSAVTVFGIDTSMLSIINNKNTESKGQVFSTSNGSWASIGGAIGPIPRYNRVLIGQFTTDGVFSFELNIQIATPAGIIENYVAKNPVGSEIVLPSLTYSSTSEKKAPENKKATRKK